VNVLTPVPICLRVLGVFPFLQPWLAASFPITAGTLTPPPIEGQVAYIKLLFLRLGSYVEEKLSPVLNLHELPLT
jgi:hypothetical protein